MLDVARAAGVSRATLYRYFPNREELVRALAETAVGAAHDRLIEADLDSVPVPEALARLTRALVTTGANYAIVLQEQAAKDHEEIDRLLGDPIRAVFSRGVAEGVLRADIPPNRLARFFGGLLGAAVHLTAEDDLGVEDACATIVTLFLEGGRARS
jgi:AcrR family transcriptional regulator